MTATPDNKPPAVNNFGACEGFDLWVDVFSHSISDADPYRPDIVEASVWAVHARNDPAAAAVSLDIESGPWSVNPDMSPARARALAAALIEAADIVDQFTARQAKEAELARFNAGPINRTESDGDLGAVLPINFTPGSANALVAEAIIREAIVFMEGFRDDSGQTDVVAILDNLEDLARTLKGGAA